MRNLAAYPLTREEYLAAIEWAMNEWAKQFSVEKHGCGDVTGAALRAVRDLIAEATDFGETT